MLTFRRHHELTAHHRYQLEVIFLFVAGLLLFLAYYSLLLYTGLDIDTWQWYFFWPWMALYVGFALTVRGSIPAHEAVNPLYRPIMHWVLLGLGILAFHVNTNETVQLPSLDIAFVVFTLLMADAYWDFKK
jgi:hypothetical protein